MMRSVFVCGWACAAVLLLMARAPGQDPAGVRTPAEARRELEARDAPIAKARARVAEAEGIAFAAWEALTAREAAMAPLEAQERLLVDRLAELGHYVRLRRLPAEIAEVLPGRKRAHAKARAQLDRILQEEENLEIAGIGGETHGKAIIAYSEEVLRRNIAYLEALDAELKRTLPTKRPPAFVPAGADPEAALGALMDELGTVREQLAPMQADRERLVSEVRRVDGIVNRRMEELQALTEERRRFLYTLSGLFEPAYLEAVRVEAVKEPAPEHRVYYEAVVRPNAETAAIDASIQFLLSTLGPLRDELPVRRQAMEEAEARFLDVAARWDARYAEYNDLIDNAYALQASLEVADSLAGILKDGGQPAGVFLELIWRGGEAAFGDFRIDEPPVSESILQYRQTLASRLARAQVEPIAANLLTDEAWLRQQREALEGRWALFRSAKERLTTNVREEQLGEAIKFGAGTAVTEPMEALAKWCVANGKGPETVMRYIDEQLFDEHALRKILNEAGTRLGLPDGVMRWIRSGDATTAALDGAKTRWKELGKNIAFAAAVTAVKDVIKAPNEEARIKAVTELALLDVEWLLRRHEYQMRNRIYHGFRSACASVEATVGALLEERAELAAPRVAEVVRSQTLSTTDALRVTLTFSRPVNDVTLRVGETIFEAHAAGERKVAFDVPARTAPAGVAPMQVTAVTPQGVELDADPVTFAWFDMAADTSVPGADAYQGFERGPDASHALQMEAPELTIVRKKDGYLRGDWIDFEWTRPGSLARRDVGVTATPIQKPRETWLPKGATGRAQYPVPDAFREYRLILFDRLDPDPLAEETFRVVPAVATPLGGEAFTDAFIAPLADRWQAFKIDGGPIAEGEGRLVFERRDAAGALHSPHVRVSQSGAERLGTWDSLIDLPPGVYDVQFDLGVPVVREGVAVEAGRASHLTVEGLGRLVFDRSDALGTPIDARVTINRSGEKAPLLAQWAGMVDLPPGRYDLTFDYPVPITRESVEVRARHETIVRVGGYGRLRFDRRDALGNAIEPLVTIHRSGEEAPLIAQWPSTVDLPPGRYDLVFDYPIPVRREGVEVRAGEETLVQITGHGRLRLTAANAAGEAGGTMFTVRHTGEGPELTTIFSGGTRDLPPGAYVLTTGSDDERTVVPFTITAGGETALRVVVE